MPTISNPDKTYPYSTFNLPAGSLIRSIYMEWGGNFTATSFPSGEVRLLMDPAISGPVTAVTNLPRATSDAYLGNGVHGVARTYVSPGEFPAVIPGYVNTGIVGNYSSSSSWSISNVLYYVTLDYAPTLLVNHFAAQF